VKCNIILLLNRAIASAETGAILVSPFVGSIYNWHKKSGGKDLDTTEDPAGRSVRDIYGYSKSNGIETIVMGAVSQRQPDQGAGRMQSAYDLAGPYGRGCVRWGELTRVLAPTAAEPRSFRTAEDGICHWFVSEDVIDIKHPGPASRMDENTSRWIMNEDATETEKLAESIRVFANNLKALRRRIGERLQRVPRRCHGQEEMQSRDDRGVPPERLNVSKRPIAGRGAGVVAAFRVPRRGRAPAPVLSQGGRRG
jgi:transaldolase